MTQRSATIADCVCPECFKPLAAQTITGDTVDRYHRRVRTAWGQCGNKKCDGWSYELEQFLVEDRWHIHRWRRWGSHPAGGNTHGPWLFVQDLPDPASPLYLGPEGEPAELSGEPITNPLVEAATQIHRAVAALNTACRLLLNRTE